MKYLSIDIEATGLNENCYMIEFAAIPFDTNSKSVENKLSFSHFIQCPSFEELKPDLDSWVIEHNEELINKAHNIGLALPDFKEKLTEYLESDELQKYFNKESIVLFGKSMNAIDLPFLNRDLGFDYMRKYFSHRILDFSSVCHQLIDFGLLPEGSESGSKLSSLLKMGNVAHTALEDAIHMAQMYLKIQETFEAKFEVKQLFK